MPHCWGGGDYDMTVYIVSDCEAVVAVFSTREAAKQFTIQDTKHALGIEEWPVSKWPCENGAPTVR